MSNKSEVLIFLADDDQDDCLLVEDALEELDIPYRLVCVDNGVKLIQELSDENSSDPDLVLLDLDMPMKHGLVCLDEIRNDLGKKSLPIVIYSTHSQPKTVKDAYLKKAQYYLRKPNSFSSLVNALRIVLETDWAEVTQPDEDQFLISA
ncbi:response regulator [Halocola ammonii]